MEQIGKSGSIGDSPVHESCLYDSSILSRAGHVKSCLNQPEPSGKAKYSSETDSELVLWRKGEKNPEKGSEKDPETVCLQAVEALGRRRAFCIMILRVTPH